MVIPDEWGRGEFFYVFDLIKVKFVQPRQKNPFNFRPGCNLEIRSYVSKLLKLKMKGVSFGRTSCVNGPP